MSIFNNEEIDRLRDEVRELRQQVRNLHDVLNKTTDAPPPSGGTPQQEEAAQPVGKDNTPEVSTSTPKPEPSEGSAGELSADVAEQLQALTGQLAVLTEKIDTATYQEKIIRDMHQELMQLKKGLIEDLKKDYLTDILNICERMGDTDRHIQPDDPGYDPAKAKQLVTNTYLYIRDHLSDQYSVEYFEPSAGEAYDPKAHRAIHIVETDDDSQAGKVASCLTGGFRNSETGRVLRQARIAVYRKKA
jgi:molecular chaperone GrpE (heat shock protein)